MSDAPAIVVALNRELRCVRNAFPHVDAKQRAAWRVSGIGPARAREAAQALLAGGHCTLACVGLAGGLDPTLGCGDLVIASDVIDSAGEVLALDNAWRASVAARLRDRVALHHGAIYGASEVVADACAKRSLNRESGAVAVDMESAAVVRAANARGARVLALRVVADDQAFAVSSALLELVDAEGNFAVGSALVRALTVPGLARNALEMASRVRRAERCLTHALSLLGPDLACPRSSG